MWFFHKKSFSTSSMIDFEALFLQVYGRTTPHLRDDDEDEDQDHQALGSSSPRRSASDSSSVTTVSPSSTSSISSADSPTKKGRRRRRRRKRKGKDKERGEELQQQQPPQEEEEDNMGLKLSKYIQKAASSTGGQQHPCEHVSISNSEEQQRSIPSFCISCPCTQ